MSIQIKNGYRRYVNNGVEMTACPHQSFSSGTLENRMIAKVHTLFNKELPYVATIHYHYPDNSGKSVEVNRQAFALIEHALEWATTEVLTQRLP
jgi:hypothetical protein